MGDRAGLTAYLLKRPLIQLEGLVADGRMLEHIQREDPLEAVLDEYRVDYLIVSVYRPLEERAGCFVVQQPSPAQAGAHALRMEGRLCGEPALLLRSPRGNLPGLTYTYVFDLAAERGVQRARQAGSSLVR